METIVGLGGILAVVLLNVVMGFALYAINLSFKMDIGNRITLLGIVISLVFIVGSTASVINTTQPKQPHKVEKRSQKSEIEQLVLNIVTLLAVAKDSRIRL